MIAKVLGYALCDFIFLPWFYKTGHSITAPALVTIFGFIIYSVIFYMAIPMAVSGLATLLDIRYGGTTGLIVQFAIFGVGLILYVLSRFLVYKISYKRLEKLDF